MDQFEASTCCSEAVDGNDIDMDQLEASTCFNESVESSRIESVESSKTVISEDSDDNDVSLS